ncbi:MAG: shikimate kinase [Kiritimatiellia bacterium]
MNAPIFLIGFMGSGKTHIGKELARKLDWSWVDLDQEITRLAGKSIPEIFAGPGESAFREMENQCLRESLQRDATVISCGGGVITHDDSRNLLLAQPRVVCLRIKPETVFRRVGNDPRRPLLQGTDAMGQIRKLMKAREPFYSQFEHQIDVDNLPTVRLVKRICKEFGLVRSGN